MRSCLFQVIAAIVVVLAVLWFALPPVASAVATAALNSSGFSGTDTKVEVSSSPPLALLTLRADRVHITATNAGIAGLHCDSLDVTLGDVGLLNRSMDTVSGTLRGVQVSAPSGDPIDIDTITLGGPGTATIATATLTMPEAQALAESQLRIQTGLTGTIKLKAPNVVVLSLAGRSATGRLITANGALILVPDSNALPSVTLIAPSDSNPLHVNSVLVGSDNVTLVSTVNFQKLLASVSGSGRL